MQMTFKARKNAFLFVLVGSARLVPRNLVNRLISIVNADLCLNPQSF